MTFDREPRIVSTSELFLLDHAARMRGLTGFPPTLLSTVDASPSSYHILVREGEPTRGIARCLALIAVRGSEQAVEEMVSLPARRYDRLPTLRDILGVLRERIPDVADGR